MLLLVLDMFHVEILKSMNPYNASRKSFPALLKLIKLYISDIFLLRWLNICEVLSHRSGIQA